MSNFSIKDLETITGIKAHTIRIWEQRYGLIQPQRTDTNIRTYSDEDLRFILNVSILNKHGMKISEIVKMDKESIRLKVLSLSEKDSAHSAQIKALISSMFSLDEVEFNRILANLILRMGLEEAMIQIIFPFLNEIGILWMTGSIHPAHEHFISNLIRQKLFVAIDGQTGLHSPSGKKFLLFLPEGEPHEIGLLFANYMLRARGHEVIYLGQNLPFTDLQSVLNVYEPEYIFTILTSGLSESEVQDLVDTLSTTWPEAVIFVSGYLVLNHPHLKLPNNVISVREVRDLRERIDALQKKVG
ncbi:MAG: MerR family transcriptional regulator [Bacteroidetes bacterium]|nr:MerR family transcriptional regulator [Bacteroidota bacterium]